MSNLVKYLERDVARLGYRLPSGRRISARKAQSHKKGEAWYLRKTVRSYLRSIRNQENTRKKRKEVPWDSICLGDSCRLRR